MPEFTPLQSIILGIIQEEISRNLVDGKCELSDAQFLQLLKQKGQEPHKGSIGDAIKALEKKGYVKRLTTTHVKRGRVRTITLAK